MAASVSVTKDERGDFGNLSAIMFLVCTQACPPAQTTWASCLPLTFCGSEPGLVKQGANYSWPTHEPVALLALNQ